VSAGDGDTTSSVLGDQSAGEGDPISDGAVLKLRSGEEGSEIQPQPEPRNVLAAGVEHIAGGGLVAQVLAALKLRPSNAGSQPGMVFVCLLEVSTSRKSWVASSTSYQNGRGIFSSCTSISLGVYGDVGKLHNDLQGIGESIAVSATMLIKMPSITTGYFSQVEWVRAN
jgi:hypothetical protein